MSTGVPVPPMKRGKVTIYPAPVSYLPDVGKVTLKINGDEALHDEFILKSNDDEALNDGFLY